MKQGGSAATVSESDRPIEVPSTSPSTTNPLFLPSFGRVLKMLVIDRASAPGPERTDPYPASHSPSPAPEGRQNILQLYDFCRPFGAPGTRAEGSARSSQGLAPLAISDRPSGA
jgi:hypothetical protein